MPLSTYTELLTGDGGITDVLDKSNLNDKAPAWVIMCEADMNRRMIQRRMICRARATIAADAEFTQLPARYVAVQTLALAETVNGAPTIDVEYLDPRNLQPRKADEAAWRADLAELHADEGHPRFYTIVGTELRLFPIPEQTYYAHLTCYERLEPLASASTNWMLEKHPDAYLYGSLVHSAPYLKDDGRLAMWKALYDTAIEGALQSDPTPSDKSRLRTEVAALSGRRGERF